MDLRGFYRALKYFAPVALMIVAFPTNGICGCPVLDAAVSPINGHTYYLLPNSDWTNAEKVARSLGGHLATIRSAAENKWVWDRWGTNRTLWIGLHDPHAGDGNGLKHAADFVWISGENSKYRNWALGEPNNGNVGEYCTAILSKENGSAGVWNDNGSGLAPGGQPPYFGVVEVPFHVWHVADNTSVAATKSVVASYSPSLSIQASGVNSTKITEHLVPDFSYQLQSSPDLINWTNVGPVFTATNEYMNNEFQKALPQQYFRLVQQAP
jgi:hypothetical protein